VAARSTRAAGLLLLTAFFARSVDAQTSGEIRGTVMDQQGLPIAGATVLIHAATATKDATLTTSDQGEYRIVGLPPGRYTLTASHDGFVPSVRDVDVTVNRQVQLDITLAISGAEERITVEARSPLVDRTSVTTGSTIVPRQVEAMPLNGRDYLDLLQLVPGVAINRSAGEGDDNGAPILGDRANNTYVLIDGMPNRDEVDGGAGASVASFSASKS
jgi:hypothetical protein